MKTLFSIFGFKILTEETTKFYSHNDEMWMEYSEIMLFGRVIHTEVNPFQLWI